MTTPLSCRFAMTAALCLVGLPACIAQDHDEGTESSASSIVNGVGTARYESVGALEGPIGTCTGTMIAPRVVLTAAHCLAFTGGDSRYTFRYGAGSARSTWAVRHPRYTTGNGAVDFGLVYLDRDVAVPRLPLVHTAPWVNQDIDLVGYGQASLSGPSGTKRVGYNTIDSVETNAFVFDGFRSNGQAASGACPGDSGGPVFAHTSGALRQIGVIVQGDCSSISVAARIDTARGWIRGVALVAANGRFVAAEGGGGRELVANRTAWREWETLKLVDLGNRRVVLQAHDGKLLRATATALYADGSDANQPAQQFEKIDRPYGKIALRTAFGRYVVAELGTSSVLRADRTAIGPWEEFAIHWKND